jgi:phosphate transport system protein
MENKHFDTLKEKVYSMIGKVEKAFSLSLEMLFTKDLNKFEEVKKLEEEINGLHLDIDDRCFKYIALQRPVATELRFVLACIKANTDLERIGDQAINIYQTGKFLIKNDIPLINEFKRMTDEVTEMLRETFNCFMEQNLDYIKPVLEREKKINRMKKEIFKLILKDINNVDQVEFKFDFLILAKIIERTGDHAQNIIEHVVFMKEGIDIRHSKTAYQELLIGLSNSQPPQV